MKKTLFMFAALVMLATSASAQFSNSKSSRTSSDDSRGAIGVNVSLATGDIGTIGFGAKAQYRFIDQFRGEASFNYFLKKDYVSSWDVNLNFHYLIPVANSIKVYPLAGVTYKRVITDIEGAMEDALGDWYDLYRAYGSGSSSSSSSSSDSSNSTGKFGANLGAGVDFDLSDSWKLNFETKYQLISDYGQVVFTVGAAYKF